MKDIADAFIDRVLEEEIPKVKEIMKFMAEETRKDLYNKTIALLDTYYWGYPNPPRIYVRVDEYKKKHRIDKNGRKHDKNGHLSKMSAHELKRSREKSLYSAVKEMENDESLCFAVETDFGYSAGLIFSEDYFEDAMYHFNAHPYEGKNGTVQSKISEWDIAKNFLFSDQPGNGNYAIRYPSPDSELKNFINNYDSRMDRHYRIAYDRVKNM